MTTSPRVRTTARWASLLASVLVFAACTGAPTAPPSAPASPASPSPTQAGTGTSPAATTNPTLAVTSAPLAQLPSTSAGCASGRADKGGDRTEQIDVAGVARTALVHVPPHASAGVAKALVLSLHGTTGDPATQATTDGMEAVADDKGFVVAYPAGVGDPTSWSYSSWTRVPDDLPFFRALLDQLDANLCLDPRRTFASGFSAGAAMSKVLACQLEDRIAGVLLVAGVYGSDFGDCHPTRPIPTLVFHGVLDPLVTWHGGRIPIPLFDGWPATRDVMDWAADWAANNGCSGDPVAAEPIGWATQLTWQGCAAPMTLYRLDDGGHTWPGGSGYEAFGAIDHDVSASQLGWSFFAAAAMP